jgi:predicted HTH domain antitoxin
MPVILSDEELQAFHLTESEARLALAIRLYQDDRISIGRAATLAGLNRIEFQRELGRREISLYDREMLENDLKYAGYALK